MAGINYDTANTGYGGNYGGGAYGCSGIAELAALGLIFGNGFDRNKDCNDCCCEKMLNMHDHHDDHNHEIDEIHDVEREVCASERLMSEGFRDLQRDTLEAKFDLDKDILINRFETATLGKDIIREIDLQSCGINRNIDDVKFKQAIFAKEASMELQKCCCDLENRIRDSIDVTRKENDKTRDLITANRIEDFRDKIERLEADARSKAQAEILIANSGTITDSLNTAIANLGSTLTTA